MRMNVKQSKTKTYAKQSKAAHFYNKIQLSIENSLTISWHESNC